MKKVCIAVLVAVTLIGTQSAVVLADDDFVHHVDAMQAAVFSDETRFADVGYHFTAFRVAERLQVIGAGMMLDIYEKNIDNDLNGEPFSVGTHLMITVPIVDVALMKPARDDGWLSLSVRYGYDLNRREHLVLFGFSFSHR
jgi:opacity protein-like surface antigen